MVSKMEGVHSFLMSIITLIFLASIFLAGSTVLDLIGWFL